MRKLKKLLVAGFAGLSIGFGVVTPIVTQVVNVEAATTVKNG